MTLQQYYEYLPQVRQLSDTDGKYVDELLEMRCPVREIRTAVEKKLNKVVLCKDLHNGRAKGRNYNDNTVEAAVELLTETYGTYFHEGIKFDVL